jgi:hypothetical protein
MLAVHVFYILLAYALMWRREKKRKNYWRCNECHISPKKFVYIYSFMGGRTSRVTILKPSGWCTSTILTSNMVVVATRGMTGWGYDVWLCFGLAIAYDHKQSRQISLKMDEPHVSSSLLQRGHIRSGQEEEMGDEMRTLEGRILQDVHLWILKLANRHWSSCTRRVN